MKIAVAFFGIPRASSICLPSIIENLLKNVNHFAEIKFFYHFFLQDRIDNPHSGEYAELPADEYEPFLKYSGLLEPRGICLSAWSADDMSAFGDAWGDGHSVINLLHQLHSLNQVTALVGDFNPDAVLFLRPDLYYHEPLDPCLLEIAAKNANAVFLPAWQSHGGYNDRFAVCGRHAYRCYGSRITFASRYCHDLAVPLHAERFLAYSLRQSELTVFPIRMHATRVRIGGRFVNERFYVEKALLLRKRFFALRTLRLAALLALYQLRSLFK